MSIAPAHLAAARAVDHLRRQLGIVIAEKAQSIAYCPVEGMETAWLDTLRGNDLALLITAARARALGLDEQAITLDVSLLSAAEILALADPLAANCPLPPLPMHPATTQDLLALRLAKHAALLPALLLFSANHAPHHWPIIDARAAQAYFDHPTLDMHPIVTTPLPLAGAQNAVATCFRERFGTSVHLALVLGDALSQDAPLTRVHSSCVTGDLLGSLRCDCGDQLRLAIAALSESGGILLYLHQEGRGIGLANKLRAYALQTRGIDTYTANQLLGFEDDERDFTLAAAILKALGISRIRLLTNNPRKGLSLKQAGITVVERAPLIAPKGPYNEAYLAAKADHGHWL